MPGLQIFKCINLTELVGRSFHIKQPRAKIWERKHRPIRLYGDDGLAIIKSKSARLADKTRKELHKCFEQFALKNYS